MMDLALYIYIVHVLRSIVHTSPVMVHVCYIVCSHNLRRLRILHQQRSSSVMKHRYIVAVLLQQLICEPKLLLT